VEASTAVARVAATSAARRILFISILVGLGGVGRRGASSLDRGRWVAGGGFGCGCGRRGGVAWLALLLLGRSTARVY
jgi:hypothetical protein